MTGEASQPAVTLRAATAGDLEAVYGWNAAPDVRGWSRRGDPLSREDHARWFAARLACTGSPMWVVEQAGAAIGVVRIDDAGERARISIALDPAARGRGIGRAAIAGATAAWRRPIVAEIVHDNQRSRACFEACGFRQVADRDRLAIYHWEPAP